MNSSFPESLVPRGTEDPYPPALEPRYGPGRRPPEQPPWGAGPPPGPGGGGRGPRRGWVVALAILSGVAVLATGVGLGWGVSQFVPGVLHGHIVPGRPSVGAGSGGIDAHGVASKVNPAIVDVNTEIGAGTGMLVTSSGEVLTNNHVIEGASDIEVSVAGHSNRLRATVMGEDPTADVALVRIQGLSGLPTVSLAGPSAARVGEPVVAIGNAGGQGGTPEVTQGSVTGLDKSITAGDPSGSPEQLKGLIQTNAPIQEGDSGGALADASGKVLGMVTAGGSEGRGRASSGASTVGFAIPASTAHDVVRQIESGKGSGSVIIGLPGYLGVEVQSLTPSAADRLGLTVSSGALVARVVHGSPADTLGITESSVITAINGTAVSSADTLGQALHALKPGEQVKVSWVDQSGNHAGNATLTSGPAA